MERKKIRKLTHHARWCIKANKDYYRLWFCGECGQPCRFNWHAPWPDWNKNPSVSSCCKGRCLEENKDYCEDHRNPICMWCGELCMVLKLTDKIKVSECCGFNFIEEIEKWKSEIE